MVGRRQLEISWVSNDLFFFIFFWGLLWLRSVVIDWICYDFLGFHMVVINCGFFGYCCGKDQQWIFVVVSVGFFG